MLSIVITFSVELFLVQPNAFMMTTCSAAEFVVRKRFHSKSKAPGVSDATTAQYTAGRMFGGTL